MSITSKHIGSSSRLRASGRTVCAAAFLALGLSQAAAEEITIATVNNQDMVIMQELSSDWEQKTGNSINWLVLEENVLRQRVTTDISTDGGQFDVITLGSYEAPIWGKNGWLFPVDDLGADYDYADIFETVRKGLSTEGKLFALPFYAESSMTYYRRDLFEKAGITMPEQPTYAQIAEFAAKVHDPAKKVYGLCLRGKPGSGENMVPIMTSVNTHGGKWFDMEWKPQINTEAWHKAVNLYVDLLKKYGPPGVTSNGYNETRALFAGGNCGMWIDATVAAGYLFDPAESKVAATVGFTKAPIADVPNGAALQWAWALAIPKSSGKADVAKSFMAWATSKEYIRAVGEKKGWIVIPPGTRQSTYDLAEYQKVAPFANFVRDAILSADPTKPSKDPVPYTGITYASIPEYQSIGTEVGQQIAAALTGQQTVDQALVAGQSFTEKTMEQSGYLKK
ncbi:ABC transporter substrate-binding protein [Agrobacterium vitis]|uniref:ABC transporter substrate-binding protein n=1 Tax=Agrobacterium vitis TaxID=373 RepID=UPI0012E875FD|nr:sugar ABC transporter substrate-binding protein [Agrobacterium vitis]MVA37526.1 extracellular solute-binding protein [Agrobacterium vitis]